MAQTLMKTLFEQLPGQPMPVAEVADELAHMWEGEGEHAQLSESHATQVNLVLHIGEKATVEKALECFDTAISFAQQYPCRIIVICPETGSTTSGMQAKLYSQCFIDPELREACCCEALILGHHAQDYKFLDSQISTWLEPDLPVFYWLHGVPPETACSHTQFLKYCSRVIYDSAVEGGRCSTHAWPKPKQAQDLARARTLPWRQSIGQILAAYPPEVLIDGLQHIRVRHDSALQAEAGNLLLWVQKSLRGCYKASGRKQGMEVQCDLQPSEKANIITVDWSYSDAPRHFQWSHAYNSKTGCLSLNLTGTDVKEALQIRDLKPHQMLAEAFYFNE